MEKRAYQTSALLELVDERIMNNGGYVNTHSHLDRAFTLNPREASQLNLAAKAGVEEKWSLVREMKENVSTVEIYNRLMRAFEYLKKGGTTVVASFIDVDESIKDKAMIAAITARESIGNDLKIIYLNQCLEGVLNKKAYNYFHIGSEFADIIGALPARDSKDASTTLEAQIRKSEHLDVVMKTAKQMGKRVHVHADQNGVPSEYETELVIAKMKEHDMEGKVTIVHGISISAHEKSYRDYVYQEASATELSFISCPNAWSDRKRSEIYTVTHNPVTPFDEMIKFGIKVAIGTDNIQDLYCPLVSGSMMAEVERLMISSRTYDVDAIVKAATVHGRKVLGIV